MRRMTNYIDLIWKTEEKFNIGSKYQPPVYHNVDNTDIYDFFYYKIYPNVSTEWNLSNV
jgi:hypothetical protein